MKTTIYELLGLIKDGKAPKKIMYDEEVWELDEPTGNYFCEELKEWFFEYYTSRRSIIGLLNDEVEILDEPKEDKIEKLEFDFKMADETDFVNKYPRISYMIETQKNKINEIIEVINEK